MGALLHDVGPYEIFVLVSDVFCEQDFAYMISTSLRCLQVSYLRQWTDT